MIKVIACDKCFYKIEKKSSYTAQIWLKFISLCYESKTNVFLIKPFYYKDLRTLEMMKFILSTDVENYVAVKVLGSEKKDDVNVIFCGGHCEKEM